MSDITGYEDDDIDYVDPEVRLAELIEQQNRNPASMAYPPLLPMELALKVDTVANTCAAHGVSRERFELLTHNPVFIRAYQECVDLLMKAEDFLTESYKIVKDQNIPASVRAKLIESTVRWAGYDKKAEDVAAAGSGFNIILNLGQGQQTQVNNGGDAK